jgi:5-formyltetrahydrofolate cyclo-ligase
VVELDKKVIREKILKKRANLPLNETLTKSKTIENKLFDTNEFKKANFIFSFISFKDEINTHEIIKNSINMGKRIGVPITVTKTKKMLVSEIKDFDRELEIGYYNILTPKKEFTRIVSPEIVDLVLVPGVAFDRRGYRVGYGGGYYDRFFSSLNKDVIKIGLCYEMQVLPLIPFDSYDIPVDYIITEKSLINCNDKNN